MNARDLQKIRVQLGASQAKLARLLGVSLGAVRRWEADAARPVPTYAARFIELLVWLVDEQGIGIEDMPPLRDHWQGKLPQPHRFKHYRLTEETVHDC